MVVLENGIMELFFLTIAALGKEELKCLEEPLATTSLLNSIFKDINSESIFDFVDEFPHSYHLAWALAWAGDDGTEL